MSNRTTTTPAHTDHIASKKRSYRVRPERGRRVEFTAASATLIGRDGRSHDEDVAAGERLTPGRSYPATVISVSNAGFRGIEMMVRLDDGGYIVGVSTGMVTRYLD